MVKNLAFKWPKIIAPHRWHRW